MSRKRHGDDAHANWFEERVRASVHLRNDTRETELSASFVANTLRALPSTPDAIAHPNQRRIWSRVIAALAVVGAAVMCSITLVGPLSQQIVIEETADYLSIIPSGSLATALDFLSALYATMGRTDIFALVLIIGTFAWFLTARQPTVQRGT